MNDTLYIQIDKNVKIISPHVCLGNIAQLSCRNPDVLEQCKKLKVYDVPGNKPGRYVVSVMDLIQRIQNEMAEVEVSHIGEPTFLLTYESKKEKSQVWSWIKTVLICGVTFFGTGFAIMTFHTDVDTPKLFANLYEEVTGQTSDGFTELELMYSIGIGIGVIFFFNHFGRKELSEDPTPIQVQMRIYEDDIDTTVMEELSRSKKGKNECGDIGRNKEGMH